MLIRTRVKHTGAVDSELALVVSITRREDAIADRLCGNGANRLDPIEMKSDAIR